MIKIVKDKSEKFVTRGAYENFYKPLGYTIVGDSNKKREVETKKEEIKEEIKEEVKEVVIKDNEDKGEKKSQKIEEFKKR